MQKVEENKLGLKLNFTLESKWAGLNFEFWGPNVISPIPIVQGQCQRKSAQSSRSPFLLPQFCNCLLTGSRRRII